MQYVGIIMIAILVIVGFIFCAKDMGLKMAMKIFVIASIIALLVLIAAWFIIGG